MFKVSVHKIIHFFELTGLYLLVFCVFKAFLDKNKTFVKKRKVGQTDFKIRM